jgi:hypothetical protein
MAAEAGQEAERQHLLQFAVDGVALSVTRPDFHDNVIWL